MNFIELIQYILLGIVQGFSEPIPISSSGHLEIFKKLLNSNILSDMNFEIIVNFGSLIAIVIFFWKDIINIIKDFLCYIKTKKEEYKNGFRYALLIVVGSIPAGIAGILLKDKIASLSDNIKIIGAALIVTALFLFIIKDFKGKKNDNEITFKDAIIIGLFQCVALLPGISRSGATIVGAMLLKLKRETAFKYSFMLYIPISLASFALGVKDMFEVNIPTSTFIYYFIGMIVAGIITYFSTKLFQNIMKKGKLIYFVGYCFVVGLLVLLFL